jgi:acetyltransferase-like isoleucine patch superfamily enzyme
LDFLKKIDYQYLKKSNKLLWIYGAYLTWKYATEYDTFPAFQYNGFIKFRIFKHKQSKLILKGPIKLEQWLNKKDSSVLTLKKGSSLICENEFLIGNNISIHLESNSRLILGGKVHESGSGITGNCVIMVKQDVEIKRDCIIAWDTFITDHDWHKYGHENKPMKTIIGEHCWIGVGVKILKGVNLNNDSIVATNSVVVKGVYPQRSFLSGIPASIKKQNIEPWKR